MTGLRWPASLWNVPQTAESEQGAFGSRQFRPRPPGLGGAASVRCSWRAGLSGVWPPGAKRGYLFKPHIRQREFIYGGGRVSAGAGWVFPL